MKQLILKNIFLLTAFYGLINCENFAYGQRKTSDISIKINSDEKVDTIKFRNFRGNISYEFTGDKKLSFKNDVTEEYIITVQTSQKTQEHRLWLEETGTVEINLSAKNNTLKIDISGSPLYAKITEYQKRYKELLQNKASARELNDFLFSELKSNLNNPYSFAIGLTILFKNQDNKALLVDLLNLFETQQDEKTKSHYTSSLLYKTLKSRISTGEIKTSEFYFSDIDNHKKQITRDNSEYVLLDFWHTACAPCIQDHEILKDKKENLNEQKIKLISISSDGEDRIQAWKKYIEKNKPHWENYIETKENSLTDHLNIRVFPTYILLDKQNKIKIYTNSLNEVLKELKLN